MSLAHERRIVELEKSVEQLRTSQAEQAQIVLEFQREVRRILDAILSRKRPKDDPNG